MKVVVIQNPLPADVTWMGSNMRPADRAELWAASGKTPEATLRESVGISNGKVWMAYLNGKPAMIFGVVTMEDDLRVGIPWMVCTPEMEANPITLLRISNEYIDSLRDGHDYLFNYVHADNKNSQKWLKWMGFKLNPKPQPFGAMGQDFQFFGWMRSQDV